MYRLIKDPFTGQINYVQRVADGAFIPMVEGNRDYDEYLAWVVAGNTPIPAGS